jgi:hypothetical protein
MRIGFRWVTGFVAVSFAWLAGAGSSAAESVSVLRQVSFAESTMVRPEVKAECQLQTKLPGFVQEYARANGIEVVLVDALPKTGRVLDLQISDTGEGGNAWTGRVKTLTISGRLLENGKEVGSFRGRRSTSGGAFGGWKGNCAFFGRCAQALGKDVAGWLKSPTANATIGE